MKTSKERKRLPLYSDIVFKMVFAKEENKDLLKSLLQAILNIKIKSIEVKNPQIIGEFVDSKAGVLDIKALINDNSVIDIEMQVGNEYNIEHRSAYYMVSTASEGLKKGELYIDFKKTIVINLLNFNYFKRNSFMHIAHMKFEESRPETYIDMGYKKEQELATGDLEMIFIELPKFKMKNPDCDSKLNKWLWLIAGEESKVKMDEIHDEELKKVIEIMKQLDSNSEEWEIYESRRRAIINYNTGMECARREGIRKGKNKGLKEGIKEGLEKGKKEKQEEIAIKLLKKNMKIEDIMEITELTMEEIKKLETKTENS